jgi:uncharacterized protein with von Willebrand factor type A (vWA) domain
MTALLAHVVAFGRELRAAGLGATPPRIERFVRALALVDLSRPHDVRAAARATLATSREEIAALDAVFDRMWLRRAPQQPASPVPTPLAARAEVAIARRLGLERSADLQEVPDRAATWSDAEQLRHVRVDRLSPDEWAAWQRLASRVAWAAPERLTRRYRPDSSGRSPDWHRTIREAVRHGGELLDRRYRARATRPRPLVVLVDVSGSMERFARAVLTVVHATAERARRARRRGSVEVFVFGTRLTRVTRAFAARSLDRALASATAEAPDWSGGTRIGEALHRFNHHWARRVLHRGPDVIIVSDGWDLGDPGQIAREAARLRRTAHAVLWVHPFAGTPGFEARTRGLLAALPFVDALVPGGTLAELDDAMRRPPGVAYRGNGSPPSGVDSSSPGRSRAAPRQVRQPPSGRSR